MQSKNTKHTLIIICCFISLIITVLLGGCQLKKMTPIESGPEITHVVLLWLISPESTYARQTIIQSSKKLQSISTIKQLDVGMVLPSPRKIVDSSFHVGIVMRFKNQKAMTDYLKHPLHTQTVKHIIKPLTRKIRVYDIRHY